MYGGMFVVKTFDFTTLSTSIPHSKLEDKLKVSVFLCFMKNNGEHSYKHLVLGKEQLYFVKNHSDSNKQISETDIIKIDNIFITFGGRVFQQTVGIPMGINCAPLLTDLFLYHYEADFIQVLLRRKDKKLAISF